MGAELVLVELAKLGLQAWFLYVEQQGLTAEEEKALVQKERERFLKNRATPLPEV